MGFRPVTVVLALLLASCSGKGATATGGRSGQVPRFTGKTLDGNYVQLEDYRGNVVLLNVWATWCAPCRQELPELAALHRRHSDAGFTVIGVSVDATRDFQKVKGMVRHYDLPYPIVFDSAASSVTTFDVKGYPTSVLIGRGGEMRWRRDGLIRPDDPELQGQIEAALAATVPAEGNDGQA